MLRGDLTGRPKKEVDKKLFEDLCGILCTEEEICSILHITDKPLNNWCKETYGCGFSEIYKKFSANGKSSLRRYQFKLAEYNATMAIWLGKQYLGQKDNVEVKTNAIEDLTTLADLLGFKKDK